jgi:hypothetical protein
MLKQFWWLNPFLISTREEMPARLLMGMMAIVLFMVCYFGEGSFFMANGLQERAAAILSCITALPLAIFAARPLCKRARPELLKRGDESAANRGPFPYFQKGPPRNSKGASRG